MQATHTTGEIICAAIAFGIVWLFVMAIVRTIERVFRTEPAPIVDEEQQHFDRVKAAKKQLPDGSWVSPKIEWSPCDAPMAPNDLTVHDRSAPGHDPKTCPDCKPTRRYSGVSYRAN